MNKTKTPRTSRRFRRSKKSKEYKRSNNKIQFKLRKFIKSNKRKSDNRKYYKRKTFKSRSRFGGVYDHWRKVFQNIAATRKEKSRQLRIVNALANDCAICLEPMHKNKNKDKNAIERCLSCLEDKDIPTKLPCDHFFHSKCIQNWKKQSNECPLCRSPITPRHVDYLNYYG